MKTQAEFIQWPGESGALYRVDNGELLPLSLLVTDSHGNQRLVENLGFHAAPLTNGQIVEVTILSKKMEALIEKERHKGTLPYACEY